MGARDLADEGGSEWNVEGDEFGHGVQVKCQTGALRGVTVGTTRFERRIAASADAVWDVVKEPASIPTWFPGVVSCTVDGNVRVITLKNGMEMPEQILTIDSRLRRFQYRITAPMYRHHLGTIDVIALGPNECLCVYSTMAEPDMFALLIGGGTYAALKEIERQALARQEAA